MFIHIYYSAAYLAIREVGSVWEVWREKAEHLRQTWTTLGYPPNFRLCNHLFRVVPGFMGKFLMNRW